MALNGKINIFIHNGRLGLETSMDPVIVSLCLIKLASKILEEQVGKKGSVISIEGLVMS